MSTKPFISVMILCYNYASLLNKALNACATQTFHDFEIVFIDNGSTDNSRMVFEEFCKENPSISTQYIFIEKNQGPTHGWNTGLPYANGEYVLFNDADDWMEPDCLYELAEKAKETNADRVTGQYQEVLPDGKILRERIYATNCTAIPSLMLQGSLFKTSTIRENHICFPDGIWIPYDAYFMFNFACVEANAVIVRKTMYNYYFNPQSLTNKIQNDDYILQNEESNIFPLIRITAEAKGRAPTETIAGQIEYLCIRNNYSSILSAYQTIDKKKARQYSRDIRQYLKEKVPGYKKNKYIKPFNNGYERAGSMAVWALIKAEKFGMLELVCRAASLKAFKKFYR